MIDILAFSYIVGFNLLQFYLYFCIYLHKRYWSIVFLYCSGFGVRIIVTSQNNLIFHRFTFQVFLFFSFLEVSVVLV